MKSSPSEAGRSTKHTSASKMLILAVVILTLAAGLTACSSGGMFARATETPTETPTLPPTNTPEPTATEVPPTNTPEPTATKTPLPTATVNPSIGMMKDRVQGLFDAGYLTQTEGIYKRLPTYDDSWAQINWFQWTPTGEEPDAFVLRTDVSWDLPA